MAAFATVEDLATFMQVDFTASQSATAEQALDIATNVIQDITEQVLTAEAAEAVTLRSQDGYLLLLPELPVTAVTSVVEDGDTLVVDDDYEVHDAGILKRVGACWDGVITVTYSHGYSTIPLSIRGACLIVARGLMTNPDGSVVSESLGGDYAVSYAQALDGLDPKVMTMLGPYSIKALA